MSYQRPTLGTANDHVPRCPTAVYRVYCTKVTKRTSKTGNLMNEVSVQILSPETVTIKDGPTVQTAGLEGHFYIVYNDELNKRGENKMVGTLDTLTKLGVPLPPPAEDFKTEANNLADAVVGYLQNMTWEMVVKSKREPRNDPATNEPLKDSAGNIIQGPEVIDFNAFDIVGLPKSITELGTAPAAF